jgi:hypothetical protein
MIENWIDEIARLAGTVEAYGAPGKAFVRSYWVFEKAEFPEALSELPAAITYVQGMRLVGGSNSGPTICYWRGVTEFHIAGSTNKQNIPLVMPYAGRILTAFLSKRTLGGLVNEFSLIKAEEGEAMTVGNMDYGLDGLPHMGIAVYWRVKESISPAMGL